MLDRTGDEGAIERGVEHAGHEVGRGRRPQAQSHRRKTPVKVREQGGSRTAAVVSIEPIASGPFGSPSSRAASTASRDSAAMRWHKATGGARRRSRSCRGYAARTKPPPISAFQRFHPLRHIGLHGVEFFGGPRNAGRCAPPPKMS